mgnify:CR=1 FL=1
MEKQLDLMLGFDKRNPMKRTRKLTKSKLSCSTIREIIKLVQEKGLSQVETARLYNVKPKLVTNLLKNERLDKMTVATIED